MAPEGSAAAPSNQSTSPTQATTSNQDSRSNEDDRNREILRLYGLTSSATGSDLAKLAERAGTWHITSLDDTKATFEPFYFFFYGSLQVPRILRDVCDLGGPEPEMKGASIKDWETKIWGVYPALVPKAGNVVKGMYWKCEKPDYVGRLCWYESGAYRMEHCTITTDEGEVIENGRTFVSTLDPSKLKEGTFDLERFKKESRMG
ncbi:hypothetical protein F4776DRAFT_609137 [Hypoxylon sp. NC0597]|nr:hypothetical protein F4776DRAFT_609137 [Hypoxylon sp. NC0597]